jgi:uncharacterized protein
MTLARSRFLLLFALLLACTMLRAEKVADLPMPSSYVNDFANLLTPDGRRQIEALCLEVHQQANAELVVVTINKLEDQSIEEFSASLEEKWKIGKEGTDRGALIVLSMSPRKFRIETGYGLEGILPDAKVGRIRDQATPFATAGNYDQAMLTAVQGLAYVIAADAHVTLTPIAPAAPTYHYQREAGPPMSGAARTIIAFVVILVLFILCRTGHIGWLFYLILNMVMGGGGGRGGFGDGGGFGGGGGGGGGDFGGSGGGESGGGGASGDF